MKRAALILATLIVLTGDPIRVALGAGESNLFAVWYRPEQPEARRTTADDPTGNVPAFFRPIRFLYRNFRGRQTGRGGVD